MLPDFVLIAVFLICFVYIVYKIED